MMSRREYTRGARRARPEYDQQPQPPQQQPLRLCDKKELASRDEYENRARHILLQLNRHANESTSLSNLCRMSTFNDRSDHGNCTQPPLIETVSGRQYVIGRIATLRRHRLYDCPSRFHTLHLSERGPLGLEWSIDVNDMFITCAATERLTAYLHGAVPKFPVRMILDAKIDLCTSRRDAQEAHNVRGRGRMPRFTRIDHESDETRLYDHHDSYHSQFGLSDYANVAGKTGQMPTVTVREVCMLLVVFGYKMYEYVGREAPMDTTYFFSPKPIPPHPDYRPMQCFATQGAIDERDAIIDRMSRIQHMRSASRSVSRMPSQPTQASSRAHTRTARRGR